MVGCLHADITDDTLGLLALENVGEYLPRVEDAVTWMLLLSLGN